MNFSQDIRLFELRVELLKNHLQEQQQWLAKEAEARRLLKAAQLQEREQLRVSEKMSSIEWCNLLVRQAEQLTNLAITYSQEKRLLLVRQEQEELALEQTIKQHKCNS
ncbi:MAG: hypothetical protein EOP45_07390 [Sphingobacteriaceae bacterium]|nr:MAG: hypothetical protein EOP45_07390 [Sphingobacteriaceae bacterium]